MSLTVELLFGVHAHQPVGNFLSVIDEAHARCYKPFLETLAAYPAFRFSAHVSGWLLDVLRERFPADMELLRAMVERGQVEMFGAGETEPVLAAISHRDRIGQITALSDKLAAWTGRRPSGAWLTERVWEATVVPALAEAGIRYVTVDDYHFLASGRGMSELTGYFTTEEGGRTLDLFPISEPLRYRFPFAPAAEAVAYIESLATSNAPAAVYFDDIEKFGIWPETYAWVYEKGWLRAFIEGVLGSKIVRTTLFRDYHGTRARGMVYLPTCSYREMNEWSLPAQAAHVYHGVENLLKRDGSYDAAKPFLRGGIWRNFLSRYPEANWMHKRVLALSDRLARTPDAQGDAGLTTLLYRAQANDAYWHGLFGGLYLPHLRRSVYESMLELEHKLDRIAPRAQLERGDLDFDGVEEIFLHNEVLQIAVSLDGSGGLKEFSSYALRHCFSDTLARQPEHYHRLIRFGEADSGQVSGIASAHERVSFKHAIEPHELEADAKPLRTLRDAVRQDGAWRDIEYEQLAAHETDIEFHGSAAKLDITKTISLRDAGVRASYRAARACELRVELHFAMPSCDGVAGRYWLGALCPGGFGQPLDAPNVQEVVLEDDVLGGRLVVRASHKIAISARPHHTVSQSEAGFERIMQSVRMQVSAHLRAAEAFELTLNAEPANA